ncbi:NAD(P)H-hydrate dehydratase [Allosphingosinicella sp.]|uniref:NAD(P)H-hydrate dehydratase n=1 Tax=Allosphingosinicella sp. TaxID=2823234 RepID=UPI0037850D5F
MSGRTILTASEMRAAEEAAIAAGTPVEELMERAGKGAAVAIWRFAGPLPALVLCGPGNNGGDGYVIARELAARGVAVRVAALGEPVTPAARAAFASWGGPVEALAEAAPAAMLIDALFGTGLGRPLAPEVAGRLGELAARAQVRVAVDLPSGVATDDGAVLSPVPDYDLTITLQTLKPAHLLQPAARHMGRVAIADIGIAAASDLHQIGRPTLAEPGPDAHKYSRGLVTIVAGGMPGASVLAAEAAAKAGAGAVRLQAKELVHGVPAAVIQTLGNPLARLDDKRIGALLLGPGLLADDEGRGLLDAALGSGLPMVLDAGALRLLAESGTAGLKDAILTPHEGEFHALFGEGEGSKVERARAAAAKSGAVIVYKGPDTVVAAPDGRGAIGTAPHWLASAGTGDVLAGTIAAMRAGGMEAFEAACAGVWLHGRAAALAGAGLIADDLVHHLQEAAAECL